jgi:hypothetical protein
LPGTACDVEHDGVHTSFLCTASRTESLEHVTERQGLWYLGVQWVLTAGYLAVCVSYQEWFLEAKKCMSHATLSAARTWKQIWEFQTLNVEAL